MGPLYKRDETRGPISPSSSSSSSSPLPHLQPNAPSRANANMTCFLSPLPPLIFLLFSLSLPSPLLSLSSDGFLLLTFKNAVVADPFLALADWDPTADNPCSWNGVMCTGFPSNDTAAATNATATSTVTSVVLAGAQLLGSIPPEIGLLPHLRRLDLSGNALNGTLPGAIFLSPELRVLSLAGNALSGAVPDLVGRAHGLQLLNLSNNALTGKIPASLPLLRNLQVLCLSNNYLSGRLPESGFSALEFLDASNNLINGTLPPEFGGGRLRYMNLSYNRLEGLIPPEVSSNLAGNLTLDLSFNNFTGGIPQTGVFLAQKASAFAGNPSLCGRPLTESCMISSTLSRPPVNGSDAPPAFAVIPANSSSAIALPVNSRQGVRLKPVVIVAIVAGDIVGTAVLVLVVLYAYRAKRNSNIGEPRLPEEKRITGCSGTAMASKEDKPILPSPLQCCLKSADEESSDSSTTAKTETDEHDGEQPTPEQPPQQQRASVLVTVDGEMELEMETLLKASAYVIGATGGSIVYKAVLDDGTVLAVRRIGEIVAAAEGDNYKDFEANVRALARLRHPNLLRLRAFFWGPDEKLLVHDFAVNGSLATFSFGNKQSPVLNAGKLAGAAPPPLPHLSFDARVRIARGVAHGLAFLHDRKCVHGNVKPSNILLNAEMEPLVADFGLDCLITGSFRRSSSARLFGSRRSMPDASLQTSPRCSTCSTGPRSPYQSPESAQSLPPNARWDVYAFGAVLLELMAGRAFSEVEVCQWNATDSDDKIRVMRMLDPAVRSELDGREEAAMSCFKIGFACCALNPAKRPTMKEVAQALDRIPHRPSSATS